MTKLAKRTIWRSRCKESFLKNAMPALATSQGESKSIYFFHSKGFFTPEGTFQFLYNSAWVTSLILSMKYVVYVEQIKGCKTSCKMLLEDILQYNLMCFILLDREKPLPRQPSFPTWSPALFAASSHSFESARLTLRLCASISELSLSMHTPYRKYILINQGLWSPSQEFQTAWATPFRSVKYGNSSSAHQESKECH